MVSQHHIEIKTKLADLYSELSLGPFESGELSERKNKLISDFEANRGWPDIDLPEGKKDGLILKAYLENVNFIAAFAYRFNDDESIKTSIAALEYWFSLDLENWNWWWNQIGPQRYLGPIAFYIEDSLTDTLKQQLSAIFPTSPSMTGANLADLCQASALGALLDGNSEQLKQALCRLQETFEITTSEGMQADFSYQQHGEQLQNGGYGESFLNVVLPWAYSSVNTQFRFEQANIDLLVNYFLDGSMWMTKQGRWDYNVCGRAIAKPDLEKPNYHLVLAAQAKMLLDIKPQLSARLEPCLKHFQGEDYPYRGYKNFWRSDYCAYVSKNYSVSVKGNSERIIPIETGNQENLKGFWLGFGSMNINIDGDDYRDIYPAWDWTKIPGVTCPQWESAAHEWGQIEQSTNWTGGTGVNGQGLFVFQLDCQNTQAMKSWFFYQNTVVALGAGICSSNPNPIFTTLNQTRLKSSVKLDNQDLNVNCVKDGTSTHVKTWVHHNRTGYWLLKGDAELKCPTRQKNWQAINQWQESSDEEVSLFELSIAHGLSPENQEYQYAISLDTSVEQMNELIEHPPFVVAENTAQLQAVVFKNPHEAQFEYPSIQANFAEKTDLKLCGGISLSVSTTCLLAIEFNRGGINGSISTPGCAKAVQVIIQYKDKTFSHTITTPEDPHMVGKSVEFTIKNNEQWSIQ